MKKLKLFLVLFLFGTAIYAQQTGYVKTAAPTYTNNTIAPISLTTGGALRVFLMGGSVTAAGDSSTQRQVIKVRPYNTDAFSVAQSGTWNIGTLTTLTTITNPVAVTSATFATAAKQPALGTAGSSSSDVISIQGIGSGTNVNTNTARIASAVVSMNAGTADGGTQRVVIASDGITQVSVSGSAAAVVTPTTAGGLTTYHLVSAATTNATVLKASGGQVYGYYIYNNNAAMRKVAFHNTASTPTAGASIFMAYEIPPNSGCNAEFTNGIAFSTGIAITTVTEATDAGTTAVGLSDLNINIYFK